MTKDEGVRWDVPTGEDIIEDIENAIDQIDVPFLRDYTRKTIFKTLGLKPKEDETP